MMWSTEKVGLAVGVKNYQVLEDLMEIGQNAGSNA